MTVLARSAVVRPVNILNSDARVLAVGAIALLILIAAAWRRIHPVLALAIAALWTGLACGLKPEHAATALRHGFGDALSATGLVLAFGGMLGAVIAADDGVSQLAAMLRRRTGAAGVVGLAAIVGLPMFFETGLLLMLPIVFAAAGNGRSQTGIASDGPINGEALMAVAMPVLAVLSALHAFLPPHPGPVAAAALLRADLGRTFALGLILAPLAAFVGGWIVPRVFSRRVRACPPAPEADGLVAGGGQAVPVGSPTRTALLLLAAPMFVGGGAIAGAAGRITPSVASALTDPTLVLLAVLAAALVSTPAAARASLPKRMTQAVAGIAPILLLIGAGGAFKQALIEGGFTSALGDVSRALTLSPLMTGWLVAAIVRNATGSATLATLTAAGVMAPLLAAGLPVDRSLLVLAVGAGSICFSHVNDAGFWQVKTYLGLSLTGTFRSWSAMEAAMSLTGLGGVLLLQLWI